MQLPQLRMEMSNWDRASSFPLPEGFSFRHYRCGDEAQLCQIYDACSLGASTPEAAKAIVVDDPRFSSGRLINVEADGKLVGSVLAWSERDDPGYGYIHMLGVLPEFRDKGLGRALTAAALKRSSLEGYSAHRLFTDDDRLHAIKLYLAFGYQPLITDESHVERWERLSKLPGIGELLAKSSSEYPA